MLFLIAFGIETGDYDFKQHFLIRTDTLEDAKECATLHAERWYAGWDGELGYQEGEIYWFNGGEIAVRVLFISQIDPALEDAFLKYFDILNDILDLRKDFEREILKEARKEIE